MCHLAGQPKELAVYEIEREIELMKEAGFELLAKRMPDTKEVRLESDDESKSGAAREHDDLGRWANFHEPAVGDEPLKRQT